MARKISNHAVQSFLDLWNHHLDSLLICFPATNPFFSLDLSLSLAPSTCTSGAKPILTNRENLNWLGNNSRTNGQSFGEVTYVIQIFLGHQLMVHSTLQVILGKFTAFVVHILGLLETIKIFLLRQEQAVGTEEGPELWHKAACNSHTVPEP